MPQEPQRQKDVWKQYSRERREALQSVDVIQISVSIPKDSKEKVLALLQPYTDRARLLSILIGATSFDRALAIGLLQSMPDGLTLDEVDTIIRFRSDHIGQEAVREIVERRGLPVALSVSPEELPKNGT